MSLIGLYLLLTVITSRSDITTNHCTLRAEKSWQAQAEQKVVVSIEAMALPVHNHYKHLLKSMGKVPHDNLLAYMTTLLLLHDTELNPGPLSNNTGSNFPCGTCSEPVTWDHRGVCCDACTQSQVKTIKHGINSFVYQGGKQWNALPADAKDIENLNVFKNYIDKWTGPDCHCGYCVLCAIKTL